MVTLSKIYTKTGDGGTTRLGDNSPVAKTDLRLEAYGTIDELNSILGLCLGAWFGRRPGNANTASAKRPV